MSIIIEICNTNAGFISAVLAVTAIFISIQIGRIPYKKKLSFYHYNDSDETGDITVHVYVSNVGSCPIYIDKLIAEEWYRKEIGACEELQSTILSNRLLNAYETREYQIHLEGYKWTSHDKRKALRIVLKSGRKSFRYRANWAMG